MLKFVAGVMSGALLGVGGMALMNSNGSAAFAEDATEVSKPAYMLVLGTVHDREAFGAGYAAKLPPLYEKFGGSYIAIGGGVEVLEGDYVPPSYVIGKWKSMAAAKAFWNSPEYDELRRARIDNNWGDFDVLLVEGLSEVSTVSPMVEAN